MDTEKDINPAGFTGYLEQFWELAARKSMLLERNYDSSQGSPVFTAGGKYTTRGWTEWTQGFQYGIPLLVFAATGNTDMLRLGRKRTLGNMAHHVTHFGVHDHGFNNLSTYGNLLRLARRKMFDASDEEIAFCRLAISASGAVQAHRWTKLEDGGFIHSFNGPHSLFIDTMRTLRVLLAAHHMGHRMLVENDREVDLLDRAVTHALTTARYAVYYGRGRDIYDVRGRVAHESVFNTTDGKYRCPNSQQGYSGFTTWTRGLAWAMLGFSEFLEYLESIPGFPGKKDAEDAMLEAATATCDFYTEHCASDGIPYWDTGAPGLRFLPDHRTLPADPFNAYEPVDSSAAAIGAQGLIRLGSWLRNREPDAADHYFRSGLTILKTLLTQGYLSTEEAHQGLLLHSVYHRPNGWDHIPEGQSVPCGESSMWGDYHLTELCYTVHRILRNDHYTFFENLPQ